MEALKDLVSTTLAAHDDEQDPESHLDEDSQEREGSRQPRAPSTPREHEQDEASPATA